MGASKEIPTDVHNGDMCKTFLADAVTALFFELSPTVRIEAIVINRNY